MRRALHRAACRRSRVTVLLVLLGVGSSAIAGGAGAHQAHGSVRAARALPEWSGIWLSDDGIMSRIGLTNGPAGAGPGMFQRILKGQAPYNAAWADKVRAARAKLDFSRKVCWLYYPAVMEGPSAFEILITRKETALIFEHGEVRHILTDGRRHLPVDERWSTPWGDSVGHWEGSTLVIDTVAVTPDWTPFFTLLSEKAEFKERIRMVGPGRLEDRLTIIDPVALTHPWTVTLPFRRVTTVDRIIHGDCSESDRDQYVNGKEVLAPAR